MGLGDLSTYIYLIQYCVIYMHWSCLRLDPKNKRSLKDGKTNFLEYLLIIGYISLFKRGIHNPYLYVNSSQMKIIRRVSHRISWTKRCIWTKKEHIHIMHYPERYIILIRYDLAIMSEPFLTNFLFWPRSDLGYTSQDLHIWCTCYINVGVNKSFLCNFHLCRRHNGCFTSTTKYMYFKRFYVKLGNIFSYE